MSHATHHHGELPHSHKVHYLKIGAILTVITAVEIGVLFVEVLRPLWVPLMVVLAVVKFFMVVGEFMHLRDDRTLYKFLFFSPLGLALLSFFTTGVLAVVHFEPFGKGYALTARDKAAGVVEATPGVQMEPAWPEDKFKQAYAQAQTAAFGDGKKIYGEKCASCHGDKGQGMPNLGVNLTDDCYKYGGKITDLYNTIAKGVPGTAMPSWAASLKGEEVRQVTYLVRSMRGTNVPGGRACEGDKATD